MYNGIIFGSTHNTPSRKARGTLFSLGLLIEVEKSCFTFLRSDLVDFCVMLVADDLGVVSKIT